MNSRTRVILFFGTRPEAIKMLPLYKEFSKHTEEYETKICVSAQHRGMLDQVLDFFNVVPDYDLNIMKPGQNLFELTANIIVGFKPVLEDFKPDYVFVHGDTTTSMAGSLAAFYHGSKVCHIEAGLRTGNKISPFPEEMNRSLTGRIADLHFAPTEKAKENLLKENIESANIVVTGNTVIDALLYSVSKVAEKIEIADFFISKGYQTGKDTILVTGHRRENFGDGFINICEALKELATKRKDIQILFPVHLNPNVQKPVYELLGSVDNIFLIEPLPYEYFIWAMNQSKIIITDSGGVQEEAPSLGKPVLVMRDITERPEAVDAGTVILVGTDRDRIVSETLDLLDNKSRYDQMSMLHNPYGDGHACRRIIDFLNSYNSN